MASSGNRAMAERYLPDAAEGRTIAAFAMTEPDAGSDAGAIATRAVRDGDDYVLDGAKIFISNATIASFFVVFARTADGPKRAISAFVVDAEHPGLTIGRRQEMMAPHPIAELQLRGCRVPAAQRLGEEGDGMRLALGTLDFFRTSVGAAACGLAARALDESRRACAVAASVRQSALADFQLTQAALADMATELDAARLLVYRAAWMKDAGRASGSPANRRWPSSSPPKPRSASSIAPSRSMAGAGVERGTVVERLYREVRALRIYEGTSEIQRLVIARQLLGG